ncbi:Na+ dependent nucleoside transporter N-terminal domain-containing protein [Stutzerimonas sp. FeSN7]|uniref:Na+ dependent nucleoside transporter N-terminal domain-containing protein n=1 Tax=Stutzerimonas sp. FeSN7 TaxID=3035479 RepID=UPI0025565EE6|nr:Na+ dependent nucleoside transporter N-terminal domain-containing protein [Stutzerimonas sp. FeSN7]MDL2172564.1 Na+ dependent nucleoside transporter N-terminal domain-containing protein [Stutzerimonas sp. FeSN7]MDL2177155.1 Na+ dependent nucleoside transporter N-terminal domain-containing protein [Stutzerimonas sp. FeSN7]
MSLVGIFVLLLIALAFSSNRSAIRLRTVVGAFLLQAGIGAFVLYVPWGIEMLTSVSGSVVSLQGYANEGISFLFGALRETLKKTF